MKKTLYFIAFSALAITASFGGTSAHAQTPGQYYMVVMQAQPQTNCTVRQSDLGLGGGVFVAGTSFCEDQASMVMVMGGLNDPYSGYNSQSYTPEYSYDESGSYDHDEDYGDYDDSYDEDEYEEDYDDEDSYNEDYDEENENDSDYEDDYESDEEEDEDEDSGSGSGSHSW